MKILGLMFLLVPVLSFSQKKNEKAPAHLIGSVGMLGGELGVRPVFQLSGGAMLHQYFIGIGTGYDRYMFSSYPVFGDWRFHFGNRKEGFVYVNSGYNFPGKYDKPDEFRKTSDRMKGGFYMDAGFGYRFQVANMHHLILSTGYTRKSMTRTRVFIYPCGIVGCNETETIYVYQYDLGRIVTRLSWEIGR